MPFLLALKLAPQSSPLADTAIMAASLSSTLGFLLSVCIAYVRWEGSQLKRQQKLVFLSYPYSMPIENQIRVSVI
jgi:hypothetical protein